MGRARDGDDTGRAAAISEGRPDEGLRNDIRVVLTAWATARVLTALSFYAFAMIGDRMGGGAGRPRAFNVGLLGWDAQWYGAIAERGYEALSSRSYGFFPLYPMVVRFGSFLLPGGIDWWLVIVSNLCAVVAAILLRRLVKLETADRPLADLCVWCLMLFPSGFVLAWGYSEALALVLVLASFLTARRGSWLWCIPAAFLAGMARPTSVLLVVPLALEAVVGLRTASWAERCRRFAATAAPLMGCATYLTFVWHRTNRFWLPFSIPRDLGHSAIPFPGLFERPVEFFRETGPGNALEHAIHLPFMALFTVASLSLVRRLPISYAAYAAVTLVVAASPGLSFERYALLAFPVVIGLAWGARRLRLQDAWIAISATCLVLLNGLAAYGWYVP